MEVTDFKQVLQANPYRIKNREISYLVLEKVSTILCFFFFVVALRL